MACSAPATPTPFWSVPTPSQLPPQVPDRTVPALGAGGGAAGGGGAEPTPTAGPTPAPDIEATVVARVQATVAAIPTANLTATPVPPLAPTPVPSPTQAPKIAPKPTPAFAVLPTATPRPEFVPTPAGDAHGNDFSSATAIDLSLSYVSALEYGGDIDVFSFTAQVGTTYTIELFLSSLQESFVYLYHAGGTEIDSSLGSKSRGFPAITWTAPSSGVYYVAVVAPDPLMAGSYGISVTPS